MRKKLFTEEEISYLRKNKYIKNISEKSITYSNEFKVALIKECNSGMFPRQIFEKYGLDPEIIGMKRVQAASDRWRKAYQEKGFLGLEDTRKTNSGRPLKRELTLEEENQRLKAEINLVKAENELLKKRKLLEKGLMNLK